jgi:hypothetical protein
MKTRLVLKPGQRGTKRLLKQYGDALVCVRFRYDAKLKQRLKTVELIVEKCAWTPRELGFPPDSLVQLFIEARDMTKRTQVKAAGGRWNPDEGLWYVRYGNIAGTALERHIQVELFSPDRDRKSI